MQLAVEEDLEGVVLQVEALLLDLVVGQEVFCVVRSAGWQAAHAVLLLIADERGGGLARY